MLSKLNFDCKLIFRTNIQWPNYGQPSQIIKYQSMDSHTEGAWDKAEFKMSLVYMEPEIKKKWPVLLVFPLEDYFLFL